MKFLALLLSMLGAAGAVVAATPFREFVTDDPHAAIRFEVGGLPAISASAYNTTDLAESQPTSLMLSSANSDPFAAPVFGTNYIVASASLCQFFCDYVSAPNFLVGEVLSSEAPVGSTLYVGHDDNGDGRPERGETLCEVQVQSGVPAQCIVALPSLIWGQPIAYWLAVAPPTTQPDASVTIVVRKAFLSRTGGTTVTGPGHALAGAQLPLRLWSSEPILPGASGVNRYYGIAAAATDQGSISIPFALTRVDSGNDVPVTFLGSPIQDDHIFWTASLVVPPGESTRRVFFDIPPTTDGSAYVGAKFAIYPSSGNTTVYFARADFPMQSSAAMIDVAPTPGGSSVYWDGRTGTPTPIALTAGRWYVVATNPDNKPISVDVVLSNYLAGETNPQPRFGAGANPLIAPGFYYNHERSGHGLSISRAGGQQMAFWYTYLEDGTPQWYQAQAEEPAEDSGWWQAPLYRVAWDGTKTHLTPVGNIILTPVATNEFMFTWNLEGKSGSERFVQLARTGACPELNGVVTNFTGAWYAPTLSGYGMDVLSLPEQQFATFYFYDELGLARWGVGSSLPFAADSTLAFNQNTGFCPSCTFAPVSAQVLGTIDVAYTSASNGNLSTNLVLKAPLSGTWTYSRPMSRLTGSSACVE